MLDERMKNMKMIIGTGSMRCEMRLTGTRDDHKGKEV